MSNAHSPLFDLVGQPHAARLLEAAIRRGRPNHAYLFTGPPGVGKRDAALKFAAALCCEQDGCGACPACEKALKGILPDIVFIEPAGSIIVVDQVREVNRSLNLYPHESRARVFIISDAEALGAEGANAFLKSLEEPPPFVFFLLIASRLDRVLPTIASRCQTVRFGKVPEAEIETCLTGRHQVSVTMAQTFARVSGGNLSLAGSLATDPDLAGRRERYLRIAADLGRGGWEGGSAEMAAEIAAASAQAGETAEAASLAPSAPEGFDNTSQKRLKQDAHRRAGAAQKTELALALTIIETWFRDLMVVAAGAGDAVLNRDYELELEDQALPSRLQNYRAALGIIENTRGKLGYNIDLGLALQAMFYELTEVL